jgi:hypothetical protein
VHVAVEAVEEDDELVELDWLLDWLLEDWVLDELEEEEVLEATELEVGDDDDELLEIDELLEEVPEPEDIVTK